MGSKPEREDGAPSAGINWKLFLLVAGIIGIIAFAIGMMMGGDDSAPKLADTDAPGADIGQGSGPDKPPVETETPEEETDTSELSIEERLYFGHGGSCNTWYEVGNIPDAILLRSPDTSGMENIYISDVKIEGRTIEFSVINPYKDSKKIERLSLGYILVGEKDDERLEIKTCFRPQTIPPKSKVAFSSDSSKITFEEYTCRVPAVRNWKKIEEIKFG